MTEGSQLAVGRMLVMALDAMGMKQTELARRTGLSAKHVNQICRGVVGISARTAVLLEEVLGVDAEHWMRLQVRDDVAWARAARKAEVEAEELRRQAWIEQVAPAWLGEGATGGRDEAP